MSSAQQRKEQVGADAAESPGMPTFGVRRALLLQGPMGPFFRRFATELGQLGVRATRVYLNAGDLLFWGGGRGRIYGGSFEGWPAYLERVIAEEQIEGIFLFGDGRPYHRAAVKVAERLNVRVFVFEEGYLRPDWITLEEGGVNGHSRMPRNPALFRRAAEAAPAARQVTHIGVTFRYGGWYSTLYSVALTLGRVAFPRYVHHRPLNAIAEAFRWVRGGLRKLIYRVQEAGIQERLVRDHAGKYFLAVLQVHCDYQLQHSSFPSIEAFIAHVVQSFAAAAPSDQLLVVKHHPLDRPYRDYSKQLRELAQRHRLGERLVYIHDQHLPTLLEKARGTVMINSTVGLQAALRGTPVKVLGAAVYDMPGITHQGTLEDFWREPGSVDAQVVAGLREFLLANNQANGNFYKRLPGSVTPTGIGWKR